jgi:hypothetical protein
MAVTQAKPSLSSLVVLKIEAEYEAFKAGDYPDGRSFFMPEEALNSIGARTCACHQ